MSTETPTRLLTEDPIGWSVLVFCGFALAIGAVIYCVGLLISKLVPAAE